MAKKKKTDEATEDLLEKTETQSENFKPLSSIEGGEEAVKEIEAENHDDPGPQGEPGVPGDPVPGEPKNELVGDGIPGPLGVPSDEPGVAGKVVLQGEEVPEEESTGDGPNKSTEETPEDKARSEKLRDAGKVMPFDQFKNKIALNGQKKRPVCPAAPPPEGFWKQGLESGLFGTC